MERTKLNVDKLPCATLFQFAAIAFLSTTFFIFPATAHLQPGQKTFPSAEDACNALVTATANNDQPALIAILGPDAKQIISSGDDAQDAETRSTFVQKYHEMHRLVNEPDGSTVLYIGALNWPTPIPLMHKGDLWYFDTDAGKDEILFRRVGRNELSTIRVCQELVAAEKDYRSMQHDAFASKIYSDAGQHDGLYWQTSTGQPESPIGPLLARAAADSSAQMQDGSPAPYRGYYYRILSRQGKNAPGGAKNYVVNGKMTEGFAFVAYPAEYKSSGVVTFIVNQDGVVYQKDLGKKTEAIAKSMKEFNPGPGWQKEEPETEQTAAAGEKTQ